MKGTKIILHAKLPTSRTAKLKVFTVLLLVKLWYCREDWGAVYKFHSSASQSLVHHLALS